MNENVQKVMERLRGSADRASERFTKVQDNINRGTERIKSGAQRAEGFLGRLRSKAGSTFSGIKDQFGELFKGGGEGIKDGLGGHLKKALATEGGEGASLLSSRLLGVAGVFGVALGAAVAVSAKGHAAAMAYAPHVRDIRLANMDKTPAEQFGIQDRVLNLSSTKGFDAGQTTDAFLATQKASGRSDSGVDAFVSQVGSSAAAMNMQMPEMVTATAKAMEDFRLPLGKVNELMDSNLKATMAGAVSYKQLAQAQEDYAPMARRTNQTLDSANALYAVMARYGKDAAGAGQSLSGAMEDLGKPKTVKGLGTIGVSVNDAKGHVRQFDQVVRDLVPQLAKMNDQQFNTLRQSIGGSAGLRELLDTARTSGNDLLDTLNQFKNTDISMKSQLDAFQQDIDATAGMAENRMNTAWIRIGQAMQPLYVQVSDLTAYIMNSFSNLFTEVGQGWRQAKEYLVSTPLSREDLRKDGMQWAGQTYAQERIDSVSPDEQKRGDAMWKLNNAQKALEGQAKDAWTNVGKQQLLNQAAGVKQIIDDARKAWAEDKRPKGSPTGTPPPEGAPDSTGATDPMKSGATAIVGGGKTVRNVTITIQKLVEKLEVRTSGTVREGISNVRQQVEQALVDIVRGGEAALANG